MEKTDPMTALRVLCTTPRTLTLLAAPPGTRYTLPAAMEWRLLDQAGRIAAEGLADSVAVFVEGLIPDTGYRFDCPLGSLSLRTPPCAGLVEAADHGADPAAPDNTAALQAAISAVPEGGTLRLAPGRYTTGPLFLKPRMVLYLPAGATLAATGSRAGWPKLPAHDAAGRVLGTWEGLPDPAFAAPLTAIDCPDLAITGAGVLDAGGDRGDWWTWPKQQRDGARRPRALHIAHSDGVSLSGLTVCNAPSWTIHPYRCRDLTVCALNIENPPDSPNTDGLNPESCQDVTITGVVFSVGDDCIAVKAGKRAPGQTAHLAPTRNLLIRHCLMRRGHGAVVLGSEMSGGIYDVEISDCTFDTTDRGLRLKTRRGRGGEIAGVTLRNVDMVDVPTPLTINAFYFCDPDGMDDWVQSRAPARVDDTTPAIRDIRISEVTARGVTLAAAAILGLPEAPVTGLRLDRFSAAYDPDAQPDVPLMALGVAAVRHAGILAENARVEGTLTQQHIPKDPITW